MALKFKNIVSVTSLGMIASETLHIVKGPKRPYIRGDKQLGGGQSEFSPSTSEVIGFAHFPLSINSGLSRPELRANVVLGKQNSKQQEDPPLPPRPRPRLSAQKDYKEFLQSTSLRGSNLEERAVKQTAAAFAVSYIFAAWLQ